MELFFITDLLVNTEHPILKQIYHDIVNEQKASTDIRNWSGSDWGGGDWNGAQWSGGEWAGGEWSGADWGGGDYSG
jgi:hypothetical protein